MKPSKVLDRLLVQTGCHIKSITLIPDPRQLRKQHSCVFMVLSQPMPTVQLICPRRWLYITKKWKFHVHAVHWHLQDLQLQWQSLDENEAIWFNNADVKIVKHSGQLYWETVIINFIYFSYSGIVWTVYFPLFRKMINRVTELKRNHSKSIFRQGGMSLIQALKQVTSLSIMAHFIQFLQKIIFLILCL